MDAASCANAWLKSMYEYSAHGAHFGAAPHRRDALPTLFPADGARLRGVAQAVCPLAQGTGRTRDSSPSHGRGGGGSVSEFTPQEVG